MKVFILIAVLVVLASCEKEPSINTPRALVSNADVNTCHEDNYIRSLSYQKGNDYFLYGGQDTSFHFNITNFSLDVCKLNYGLGREHFKALINPQFQPLHSLEIPIDSLDKAVVIHLKNGNVRVYPYRILRQHETVNDVVDGEYVAVVLCFLADLAVVYDRKFCGTPFTFAVSGYTYLDPTIRNGLESFVLWDRDTESLWWPIIDKAVSGVMKGHGMNYSQDLDWEILRWHEVQSEYPRAEVLQPGQTMQTPSSWHRKPGC